MSLALLFHYLMLNMFQMLIHPSSGACNLFVELFHGFYCSVRIEVFALAYLFSGECLVLVCVVLESVFLQILAAVLQQPIFAVYSTIKMMHGPINIRKQFNCRNSTVRYGVWYSLKLRQTNWFTCFRCSRTINWDARQVWKWRNLITSLCTWHVQGVSKSPFRLVLIWYAFNTHCKNLRIRG